jgi:hypothetical protein
VTAVVTLLAFVSMSCSPVMRPTYGPVPLTYVRANGEVFRFELANGTKVDLRVDEVRYPWILGHSVRNEAVAVDMRQVKVVAAMRMERDNAATTIKYFVVGTGVAAGVVVLLFIIVLLTKTSCPFVYVEKDGRRVMVGEAYSGAAFASIARDDLLPTPLPDGGRVRAWLSNEAHETQLTDLLELVTVDHDPGVRVLSTFDARAIGAGTARPPIAARDGDGRDVLGLLAAPDQRLWQTDLAEVSARPSPPLRESLDLTFEAPPAGAGGAPVLELELGNTAWVDALMGRFFALMGDHLPGYIATGNDASSGDKIRAWREREGLDLRVEVEVGGVFRRVAVVPTVGPATLRRVAVPLPPEAAAAGRPVRVRVVGGVGFWRVDAAALSRELPLGAPLRRIAPELARDPAGRDFREALRATDGQSHVLGDRGDSLELAFALPPLAAGKQRAAFVLTHGYYNVHAPPQGDWSPLVLREIRDEPGALAAFGLGLFRSYMRYGAAEASR